MKNVKTTINVGEDLWKKFSILVIQEEGYRKKNGIIIDLIREYVRIKEEETENKTGVV